MNVFGRYAEYYDLLYEDKDYGSEAEFVDAILQQHAPGARTLLELGCGTGLHAAALARSGYDLCGVDISGEMVARAEARRKKISHELAAKLEFRQGDVRQYRCARRFDAVISLFHVISYQTSNRDLLKVLTTAKEHMRPGGVFLFDCWYGPAVLRERPQTRLKVLENESLKVLRFASPEHIPNENRVNVHYHVVVRDKLAADMDEIEETHEIRYLFRPEIELLLHTVGLELITCGEWMTAGEIGEGSWNVYFVARG